MSSKCEYYILAQNTQEVTCLWNYNPDQSVGKLCTLIVPSPPVLNVELLEIFVTTLIRGIGGSSDSLGMVSS